MKEQELKGLDAFIAEHVMGCSPWKESTSRITCILEPNEFVLSIPNKIVRARIGNDPTINFKPTTDAADAMAVLKKCAERSRFPIEIDIRRTQPKIQWRIETGVGKDFCNAIEGTLEMAVCRLAVKLFTK